MTRKITIDIRTPHKRGFKVPLHSLLTAHVITNAVSVFQDVLLPTLRHLSVSLTQGINDRASNRILGGPRNVFLDVRDKFHRRPKGHTYVAGRSSAQLSEGSRGREVGRRCWHAEILKS